MPSTFSCQGEELALICIKPDETAEQYTCISYDVKEKIWSAKELFLIGSLIVSFLALPACVYLALTDLAMAEHWETLESGFLVTLVFGFAYFVLHGDGGKLTVKFMRCVFGVGYLIGLTGIVMGLLGVVV